MFDLHENIPSRTTSKVLFTAKIHGLYVFNIPHVGKVGEAGYDSYHIMINGVAFGTSAENNLAGLSIPSFTNTFFVKMKAGDVIQISTVDKPIEFAGALAGYQILSLV